MATPRESFLRDAFARLDAEGATYAVTRNAEGLFTSASSDIDLVVPPGGMARVEELLTRAAEAHGFRQIARIEFTNLCLVYWSQGAEFVRIDLDGELRWHGFEVADAAALLDGAARQEGVVVISRRAEWAVLADRLAWQGSLPARYRERVDQLLAGEEDGDSEPGGCLADFLKRGDSCGLRRHLIVRTLLTPRLGVRAIRHGFHDLGRMIRRALSPPGVFLRVADGGVDMDWGGLFRIMSMAFPEAKCVRLGASPLRGLVGLFRGGVVVAEQGGSPAAWVCGSFASRRRRFRVAATPGGCPDDLVVPPAADKAAAFADVLAAAILSRRETRVLQPPRK